MELTFFIKLSLSTHLIWCRFSKCSQVQKNHNNMQQHESEVASKKKLAEMNSVW